MALRPVRGVLVIEGVQTGDGRVIVDGATTWVDPPLPLAWLADGDQHVDLIEVAPQVGTIDTITRGSGGEINFTGAIDDAIAEGAEVIRRLEAGSASSGSQFGLSIDPDDYEVQIVATDATEEDGVIMLVASGTDRLFRLRAAAGDGDPGDSGVILFEDSADSIIERYTRLRIRGATMCAVAAFDGAYLELAEPVSDAPVEEAPAENAPPPAVVASGVPVRPPSGWFSVPEPEPGMRGMIDVYGMPVEELLVEQPDGGLGVPLVITDSGLVFGHAARWGQEHTGYPGLSVTPPESMAAYAHFHVGEVVCDDASRVATGALVVGCDHAGERMGYSAARDHYANSGLGWADVRATNGALGVWVSGSLRPGVTDSQLRVLRALSLSGDWRRIGGHLEFIAALAVNVPGFPVAREAIVAAAYSAIGEPSVARARFADGAVESLVASGIVQRCPDCQRRALAASARSSENAEMLGLMRTLELRTRHLRGAAAESALTRIRG